MDPAFWQNILEKAPMWRRRILQATLFLTPLVVVRSLNDAINVPKLSFLILGLSLVVGLWVAEIALGRQWDGAVRGALIPVGLILVPLALAWLFTDYKYWSLLGEYPRFQGVLPYALFGLLAITVGDTFKGRLEELLWPLAASAGAVGFLGVLQALNIDPFPRYTVSPVGGTVSTLGNPNFVGGFLAIVLPLTLTLLLRRPDKQRLLLFFAAAQVGGTVATFSQGAFAAAAAGLAVFAALYFRERKWFFRIGVTAAAGAMLISIAAAALPLFSDRVAKVVPLSVELRGLWWEAAAEMGSESPIWGHGPNAFGVKGVQYRSSEEAVLSNFEFPDDPHSVPMSMFANAGLLGLLGFLGVGAWLFREAFRSESVNAIGLAAAGAAYFAQSLVSIDELTIRLAFWSVVGGLAVIHVPDVLAERSKKKARGRSEKMRPMADSVPTSRSVAASAAVIVPLLAMWFVIGFLTADRAVVRGKQLFSIGDPVEANKTFAKALAFREETEYRHAWGFEWGRYIGTTGESAYRFTEEMNRAFSYVPEFPDLPAIRDHARLLMEIFPEDQSTRVEVADLYTSALEIDPLNPLLRGEALAALVLDRRYGDVVRLMEPVSEHLVTDATALGALAISYKETGDDAQAIKSADQALALNPQEPNALAAKGSAEAP